MSSCRHYSVSDHSFLSDTKHHSVVTTTNSSAACQIQLDSDFILNLKLF